MRIGQVGILGLAFKLGIVVILRGGECVDIDGLVLVVCDVARVDLLVVLAPLQCGQGIAAVALTPEGDGLA